MSSPHVLLLAYHFPPLGGAGAQRNTKVARYLPELGYELTVITGRHESGHRWAPVDASIESEIPPEVAVHRIAAPEPPWSQGGRRRAERWLRLEWPWQRWWEEGAVPLAVEAGREADVVYCSLAPFATARAARRIADALGKPLILDLEDPWALDEMLTYETEVHRRLERRQMRKVLASADGIVMNTPEAAARVVEEFQELRGTPIVSILNGYDAADFEAAELRPDDGRFRIVHTGSLHSAQRARGRLRRVLGGGDEGVDVGTRSLRFLLKAIDELPEALQEKVQIHVAGRLTDLDRASFEGRGNVHEHGFLAHRETLALMRTADLLFLPMHDVQPGRRVAIVPCKTYEYLGSQRPILAAVPEGDARDMLMEAGNAFVCRPKDVEGMRAGLVEAIDRWAAGTEPPAPSASLLQRVERRHLTRSVADFLDAVAGRSLDRGAVAELA